MSNIDYTKLCSAGTDIRLAGHFIFLRRRRAKNPNAVRSDGDGSMEVILVTARVMIIAAVAF
ncbi:MAG: hypothetical protein WA592_23835, partial [Pseudolabrys sp.]